MMDNCVRFADSRRDSSPFFSTSVSHALKEDLGDRLLVAFNTPSGIPFSDVNLYSRTARSPAWSPDSSTAEVATVQLEFRDLSRVVGDPKYEVLSFNVL